jgi:8-hydroxy-5-deazaflavin:NADPH oxidoreductase
MRIAIIGTGNVGSVLGRRLGEKGHEITFISRSSTGDRAQQLSSLPGVAGVLTSLSQLDSPVPAVIYAGPYDQAQQILADAGDLADAVLIDCTNPLNRTFDGLQLGHTESAGEKMAQWVTNGRVVKAFNTTSVATMADPTYGEHTATQFFCGDDPDAKKAVASLIRDLGMEPVDAGPLSNSRYLEATAMLYIHLAVRGGWGGNCALKMLKRTVD